MWKIYEEQKTDDVLNGHLKNILVFVYKHLVSEANNSLISEYAKRETSWKKLKETTYPENLIDSLQDYLISEADREQRENEKEIDTNNVEDTIFLISEIQKMGIKFWDGFKIYIDKNKLDGFDFMLAFDLLKKLKANKNLTTREISFGKKALDFIQSNPVIVDEIKSLSKLEDSDIVEIKFIYDKLLLLSKDDWNRINDIANHTKIFNNLEHSNLKAVQLAMSKKEKIKEQAIIRAGKNAPYPPRENGHIRSLFLYVSHENANIN